MYDWSWVPVQRLNLSDAPGRWNEMYDWLDKQTTNEVVLRINEENEYIAYIVEVDE